jgi:hypothetical protein
MLSVEFLATSAQPVPNASWKPTWASSGKAAAHLTKVLRFILNPVSILSTFPWSLDRDERHLLRGFVVDF